MNKEYMQHVVHAFIVGMKWILFGGLIGVIVGAIASFFAMAIVQATAYRQANGWLICLLPLVGLLIVFLYQKTSSDRPRDTNRVITAIREREHIPFSMAPLIIVSTVLTHLFGGSVGREGAALQVGGSIADFIGKIFHFHKLERRRVIMCGMSAAFSALFGTPLAAAILSMEISTVGIMYYAALVPCMVSALTAHYVAGLLGVSETILTLHSAAVTTDLSTAIVILVFAALCAPVSSLFCTIMHKTKQFLTRRIPNPYLRVVICGVVIILMTILVGDQTYNGTGADIIASCINDPTFTIASYAFLLKMVFTAITLGGGFQGGEIVPSLFIGATFGHTFATLTGGNLSLYSAIGMACVFCGVTNCPIASLLISCEMFGFEGSTLYLLAIAITYLFSGNYGLYSAQHILDSKFDPGRIDSFTH
jgi:H+/Cl- antiporter ClcA